MTDDGYYQRVFEELSVTSKVNVGRRVARMLDFGEIPAGQSRTAIRGVFASESSKTIEEIKRIEKEAKRKARK